MASPGEQDARTRHVGTAWRHQSDGIRRRGEGVPDGTTGEAAAVDLCHQTLAIARNRLRVRRRLAGAPAAALAEWGSTTGQLSWPGAEGGHCPARFAGSGHHGDTAEKVNQKETSSNGLDAEHIEVHAEAQHQQGNHNIEKFETFARK